MLSRALFRNAASLRVPVTFLKAAPALTRDFHVSSVKSSDCKAAAPVEEEGIVAKYGTIPFFGMVAAIAISKEIYIIDAEWLLAMTTGVFCLGGYVTIGDSMNKYVNAENEQKTATFEAANDFAIELFGTYKASQASLLHKPSVLRQYAEEYKAAAEQHAAYRTVLPKHAARAKVLAALQNIQKAEEMAAAAEWTTEVNAAVLGVTNAFLNDKGALADEMIEQAIANLGFTDTADPKADPVARLFAQQLKLE